MKLSELRQKLRSRLAGIHRRHVFAVAHVLVLAVCTAIPLFVHPAGEHHSPRSFPLFHHHIFHFQWYCEWLDRSQHAITAFTADPNTPNIKMLPPSQREVFLVWDIWAIIQTFLLSLLILLQTNQKWLVVITIVGVLSGGTAVVFFHDMPLIYLIGLWLSVAAYSLSDVLLWRSKEIDTFEYFALWHYVDVPTLLGLGLLIAYQGTIAWLHDATPTAAERIFLSGAIAFQLMFGNVIIVLTKTGITNRRFNKLRHQARSR